MSRPPWDFDYRSVSPGYGDAAATPDVVIALRAPADERKLRAALSALYPETVESLLCRAPLFWYRVQFRDCRHAAEIAAALSVAGVEVRYVTSSVQGSLALGERLDPTAGEATEPRDWPARSAEPHAEPISEGRWFLNDATGAAVERAVCGTGAGTRLAVIDDEAGDAETLALDREIAVGAFAPPRGASHGSLMVAWGVGANGDAGRGIPAFTGVAPDASPRLYVIPKPGREVVSLPVAIVRAADDGADVIVCATHVEGVTSPLLDDALTFANLLGRCGRGTAVVVPTGREISSPPGSLHSSLTLGFGDLASDPRVLCISPSGRDGSWFLWADKRGMLRPFANRGPAVRLAAPGDDMAHPFLHAGRLGHAESSGASAIAAGVALLVLATNPELDVGDLYGLLSSTASTTGAVASRVPADPADTLPSGRDRDGHDAKCGYGRISAMRACLSAADPVASALVAMGEDDAARRYRAILDEGSPYSAALGAWAARVLRCDAALLHCLSAILRHLRLLAGQVARQQAQPSAATARQLVFLTDRLALHVAPETLAQELASLREQAVTFARSPGAAEAVEDLCVAIAGRLWLPRESGTAKEARGFAIRPVGSFGRSA